MPENEEVISVAVRVTVPTGVTPQPANHFVFSFWNDDFALDASYIHPFDVHAAKQKSQPEPVVQATMVARLTFGYRRAVELRARLDEMIRSYEANKK